jgi:hypothetical protein
MFLKATMLNDESNFQNPQSLYISERISSTEISDDYKTNHGSISRKIPDHLVQAEELGIQLTGIL